MVNTSLPAKGRVNPSSFRPHGGASLRPPLVFAVPDYESAQVPETPREKRTEEKNEHSKIKIPDKRIAILPAYFFDSFLSWSPRHHWRPGDSALLARAG